MKRFRTLKEAYAYKQQTNPNRHAWLYLKRYTYRNTLWEITEPVWHLTFRINDHIKFQCDKAWMCVDTYRKNHEHNKVTQL